jgi:hypothetical protein
MALAVLGTVGVVSAASAFASAILTAVLVTVFSVAAGGAIMLVVILRRTRGVVTWPMRMSRPPAAGRLASAQGHVLPAPGQPAGAQIWPVAGAVARPAIPARQPLAIGAPAPAHAWVGVPGGSRGLAMTWRPGRLPANVPGGPAPEADLPRKTCPGWAGLVAAEVTPDHGELRVGRPRCV